MSAQDMFMILLIKYIMVFVSKLLMCNRVFSSLMRHWRLFAEDYVSEQNIAYCNTHIKDFLVMKSTKKRFFVHLVRIQYEHIIILPGNLLTLLKWISSIFFCSV